MIFLFMTPSLKSILVTAFHQSAGEHAKWERHWKEKKKAEGSYPVAATSDLHLQ